MAEVRISSPRSPVADQVTMTPMPISIVYTTARRDPRLDWLLDGLESQGRPDDQIELVVVDGLGRSAGELGLRPVAPITHVVVTPPKPSPWQGPQRVTSRDFWAASSARNTGIAMCGAGAGYIVFLDDCCRLGPRWLATVRAGARGRPSVLAGAYDKIDDGRRVRDHRLERCPRGQARCGGGWLYGGNFAAPLAWLLDVNGLEEGCDGAGGEDCVLGHMLAHRGCPIEFSAEMFLVKERPRGSHHQLPGVSSGHRDGRRARAALARFGSRRRTEYTPDLAALRLQLAAGGRFPDVDPEAAHLDWYSGIPLREIA